MRILHILAGLFLTFLLLQPLQAVEEQAGVVLSFDDTYVDQWYDYFSQNAATDVRATFFVSHWHTLSASQINKLKLLEVAGHEIANHSYSHKGIARDYNLDPVRIDEYLNNQIIPSLLNMRADGFEPVSFSYPYGERNEAYDSAIRQYFPYLRTTFADQNRQLFQIDDIFHSASKNYNVLAGDGIDNSYNNPVAEIDGAFLRAKTNNEIVTLYAHRIVPDASSQATHDFGVRVSHLNQIIAKAREMGLRFYTFREAYEVGNNQPNPPSGNGGVSAAGGSADIQLVLEGNRVLLQWTGMANDFIGIVPVGQPGWIDGMAGAVTDGSQNGKIGINITSSNTGQQYLAIFYKNNVEVGKSQPFTIMAADQSPATGQPSGTGASSGSGGGGAFSITEVVLASVTLLIVAIAGTINGINNNIACYLSDCRVSRNWPVSISHRLSAGFVRLSFPYNYLFPHKLHNC